MKFEIYGDFNGIFDSFLPPVSPACFGLDFELLYLDIALATWVFEGEKPTASFA